MLDARLRSGNLVRCSNFARLPFAKPLAHSWANLGVERLSSRFSCLQNSKRTRSKTQLRATAATVAGHQALHANGWNLAAMLLSVGAFLLGVALAALALAAIPAVLEMRKTAREMQRLMRALEQEVPDTASAVRVTGLELSDALQEVTLLSNDVTRGLKATARILQDAEKGIRQGVGLAQATATKQVLPALRAQIPQAKGAVVERLKANAKLRHNDNTLLQLAMATKTTARRIRIAMAVANLVNRANLTKKALQKRATFL